uniref:Leucine-rich repeat-containing N-terminal plant-type domain-containing protein n=1 Tax=Physcomitrium patens TaxID=3218 RepID=A0A2K1IY96_PHYPA|nr:hypothetical protein PHYPA_024065 [Physcomitrium patens]
MPICNAGDRDKLLQFKSQLDNPENPLNAWQPGSSCCNWGFLFVVECNGAGRINTTYLTDSFDDETIPAGYQVKVKLGVRNPGASLGDLTELTTLVMRRASFRFAYAVPPQFGKLVKLERFTLENRDFIRRSPEFIGNLAPLSELSMTGNQWTGGIPITQLTKLDFVSFDDNKISGCIPKWLGNLKVHGTPKPIGSRGTPRLAGNPFTSQIIGELCNIKDLNELYISGTNIANCKKLFVLHLNNNKLQGQFPGALTQLTSLSSLYLGSDTRHRNQLTGPFPLGIGDLNLIKFDVGNNKLHGLIPSSYGPFELGARPGTKFSGSNCWSNPL